MDDGLGPVPGAAAPRRRVLIVEDEDNIALALGFLVSREGFAHSRVASGGAALPAIRAGRPDLVLLDVMLPELSGFEICAGVRADPALAGVRILMMTARGSVAERARGMAMGADGFVAKPFDLAGLRAELHRLLPD
jgi:DNA-binding response OmpR family regulator